MLFERGPLDPFDVDRQFRPSTLPPLEPLAAGVAAQLGAASGVIGVHLAIMGGDTSEAALRNGFLELGAQEDELVRQANAFDLSIGGVAAAAGGQETTIVGLSNEAAVAIADAAEPEPPPPQSYLPEASWGIGENNPPTGPPDSPPPGGTVADFIIGLYEKYLRRTPVTSEINAWSDLWPNADAIEHGILFSGEYHSKVNGLYQAYLERDVEAGELEEYHQQHASLDAVEQDVRDRA